MVIALFESQRQKINKHKLLNGNVKNVDDDDLILCWTTDYLTQLIGVRVFYHTATRQYFFIYVDVELS